MRLCLLALALLALAACTHKDPLLPEGDAEAATDPTYPGDPLPSDPQPGDPMTGPTLTEVRGYIHMHSAYSHDGCDNNPQPGGAPNADCVTELRQAACANEVDFVAMTDHPAIMKDHTMVEDLYYDAGAGDVLVEENGEPIANRISCASGRKVLFEVGFESTHTTAVGLHHHPGSVDPYGAITDAETLSDCIARVQALKDAGAVAATVHSEETDLSAQRIIDAGIEAMEWYNIHASILALTKTDTLTGDPVTVFNTVKGLEPFLLGSSSGANADLIYLLLLNQIPMGGFDKWATVNQARAVTGMLGSDIHRNASVAPVCSGSYLAACEALAALYPNTLTLLVAGGQIVLSDGDRLDSYARLQRWLENHLLVDAVTPQGIAAALKAGRAYGVFSVFGDPQGFGFKGAAGTHWLAMGDAHSGPITLTVHAPALPVCKRGAPFSTAQAATAELRTSLFRSDSTGTTLVREVTGLGQTLVENVSTAGAYHVELHIRPKHLAAALGSERDLANPEYLWLISNPIRVTP